VLRLKSAPQGWPTLLVLDQTSISFLRSARLWVDTADMAGLVAGALFFPFCTWRIARGLRAAWSMDREEVRNVLRHHPDPRWRCRAALIAPGAFALGVSMSLCCLLFLIMSFTHSRLVSYVALGADALVLLIAAAATSAYLWGVPSVFVLPAFRDRGAFRRELEDLR
jgi:hypothetical protein